MREASAIFLGSQYATDLPVAGDLMEGRDDADAGVFGAVRTEPKRLAATGRAAATYYRAWSERLADQGLTPFPALGDHEIGDNPWRRPADPWMTSSASTSRPSSSCLRVSCWPGPTASDVSSTTPTRGQARDTACAVRLDRKVLVVTINPFTRRAGDVRASIDRAQLAWMQGVLREARRASIPLMIVQRHTLIAGPVRHRNSSTLYYQRGTASAL